MLISQTNAQDIFSSIEKKFTKYKNSVPKERVQIITDRDIYASEDLVWFDVTTFENFAPRICDYSKEVKVYLVDRKGKEIYGKKIPLAAGVADGFIEVPKDFTDGVYYIQATTENTGGRNYYQKKIIIKNKIVQRFIIETSFPNKEYIPGDQFEMEVIFKELNAEQKRNVEYRVDFYDGEFEMPGVSGKSDKTGKASVSVKVPTNLKSREFSYKISAKSKKIESYLHGKFPVLTDQLYIDFYPENGKIIDGISTTIRTHAYDISGFPLAIEADLLEDGKSLLTITSATNGLGSFEFTPDIEKNYEVQLKRPLFLEKKYSLLPIEGKGIALTVLSKDHSKVSYTLINGYQSNRAVYLVGFSDGEIFWTSEHEINRELAVDIDLTKAQGRWAHLAVFNAAEKIEGEHFMLIPGKEPAPLELATLTLSTEKRGKIEHQVNIQSGEKGKLVFAAVNNPWIIEDINNQNIASIALPADLYRQSVFQGVEFNQSDLNDEVLEKYINYYIPDILGMEEVFNAKSAFSHINERISITGTLKFTNPFISEYKEVKSNNKRTQTNMLIDDQFVASNSEYMKGLYKNKKLDSKPAYKEMLENNTPVMDVLQVIKPYSLEGSNIVFVSSAISISSPTGALIIIDGINSGTGASAIQSLNPLDVESIRVSTEATEIQRYSSFNPAGVIDITLKDGSSSENEKQKTQRDQNTEFSAPDYEGSKSGPIDYRSTLFWDILSLQGEGGQETFTFYNSDLVANVKCAVYFIPKKGVPSKTTLEYDIK